MEYFKTFNKDRITISSNKKRITSKNTWPGSIYGVFVIDNDFNNKTVTKWLFKIHSLGIIICIGIDSSNNNKHMNTGFYAYSGTYGYLSNGYAYNNGTTISNYDGDKYVSGDTVTMVHNPINGTLTYSLTHTEKTWYGGSKEIIDIKEGTTKTYKPISINKKKKYKLCVYLRGYGASIELLQFEQSNQDNDANDNDNQHQVIQIYFPFFSLIYLLYFIQSQAQHSEKEKKEQELKEDIDMALAMKLSLKQEQERQQRQKAKQRDTEKEKRVREHQQREKESNTEKQEISSLLLRNASLEQQLNQNIAQQIARDQEIQLLKRQILQITQQKEEFEEANHRQRSRMISIQSEVEQLRNERDSIQNQYQSSQV